MFLIPVCFTYWPRKYTTRVDQDVDNSHHFWSWYDHTLPSYRVFVCRYVTWRCDLDLWPFDLEKLAYKGGNVTSAGWQVTLYDPIWRVSSRSGVATLRTAIHLSLTYMAGHVSNLATKYENPTPIRSWVMSYNVSRWLPLKMHTRPLHMRRSLGWKRLHFWNLRLRFAYSLYNFYWASTTIKGRLLSRVTNAKTLDCVNSLCVTLWPWPLTV